MCRIWRRNGGMLMLGVILGSLYSIWKTENYRATNSEEIYESQLWSSGRSLTALQTEPVILDWSVIFDSDHRLGTSKEKQVKNASKIAVRPKTGRVKFLEEEVLMSHILHVSVLCHTLQDDLCQLAKVTWGQGHEDNVHFFHPTGHSALKRKQSEDVYVSDVTTDPVTLTLHYLCDEMIDSYKWHLLVSDTTYVMVDNIQTYLEDVDTTKPYVLGHWARNEDGNLEIFAETGVLLNRPMMQALCPYVSRATQGDYYKYIPWLGLILYYINKGNTAVYTVSPEKMTDWWVTYPMTSPDTSLDNTAVDIDRVKVIGDIHTPLHMVLTHQIANNYRLNTVRRKIHTLDAEVRESRNRLQGHWSKETLLKIERVKTKYQELYNVEDSHVSFNNCTGIPLTTQQLTYVSQLDKIITGGCVTVNKDGLIYLRVDYIEKTSHSPSSANIALNSKQLDILKTTRFDYVN